MSDHEEFGKEYDRVMRVKWVVEEMTGLRHEIGARRGTNGDASATRYKVFLMQDGEPVEIRSDATSAEALSYFMGVLVGRLGIHEASRAYVRAWQ